MTAQQELTLLETAYANFLTGGGVTTYTIGGRSVTRAEFMKDFLPRIDMLRAAVARQTEGSVRVAQFRNPE